MCSRLVPARLTCHVVKAEKDVSDVPSTQAHYWLWRNRLESYRHDILDLSDDRPVTAQDIHRCLTSHARELCRSLNRPLHVDWAKNALVIMKKFAARHHRDFKPFTEFETASLDDCIIMLLAENILTREALRVKHTVTLPIASMLIQRFLLSTIFNSERESLPTSRLLSMWAFVVVLVATGARPGDIVLNDLYNTQDAWQYLRYADVRISAARRGKLIAELTIRASKGHKQETTQGNVTHRFSYELDELAQDFFIDPVLAILVLAIRSGNLPDRSLADVVKRASKSPAQLIEWQHPSRPVFHTFTTNMQPLVDAPLGGSAVVKVVDRFMAATGVDPAVRITPYSFRRGAANDVVNLVNVPGHNEQHARDLLGHSEVARFQGTTKIYTGTPRVEWHTLRREQADRLEDPLNPVAVAIQVADARRRRRRAPPDGLDNDVLAPPRRPRKRVRAEMVDKPVDEEDGAFELAGEIVDEDRALDEEDGAIDEEDRAFDEEDRAFEPDDEIVDEENRAFEMAGQIVDEAGRVDQAAWLAAVGSAEHLEEEMPVLNDHPILAFKTTHEWVDTLSNRPDNYSHKSYSNGSLYRDTDSIEGFEAKGDDTYRCTTCFRDVKSTTKHAADCGVTFTPAFWRDMQVDEHDQVSFSCTSCDRRFF